MVDTTGTAETAGEENGERADAGDGPRTPPEPPHGEGTLSLDEVFEIAKNERRRLVIRYLQGREAPVELSDLAEHVAASENDKTVQEVTATERKRAYVGLYQCHLPKMDRAGVVSFERNPGITAGPNIRQVAEYLDLASRDSRPWHRYYLALCGASLPLLVGAAVWGTPTSIALVGTVVTLSVAGVAFAHAWAAER